MTKEVILNKENIIIYKNNTPLGGVFDFGITVKSDETSQGTSDGLYEILTAEPWGAFGNESTVETRLNYEITIKQYNSLKFNDKEQFDITFSFNGSRVRFSNNKVKSVDTHIDKAGRLVTVTVIDAALMEELDGK